MPGLQRLRSESDRRCFPVELGSTLRQNILKRLKDVITLFCHLNSICNYVNLEGKFLERIELTIAE